MKHPLSLGQSSYTSTHYHSAERIYRSLALHWGKERDGNLVEEEIALYFFFFFLRTYLFVVSFV